MHLLINAVVKKAEHHEVNFKDKAKAIEIMVAESIAASLTLPTTEVSELHAYFSAHCKVHTLQKLAEVNETIVIDIDRAAELVYKIWCLRYSLVHRMNDLSTGRFLSHVVASGSGKIPECYSEVISKYPTLTLSRYEIDDAKEYINGN